MAAETRSRDPLVSGSLWRALEIVPPALVWMVITAPVWAAILVPDLLGIFLGAFSAYWLWRSVQFATCVVVGAWRLRAWQARDWAAEAGVLPGYDEIQHLVIIPTCGESEDILVDTLHHLALQTVPLDRVAVVLAFEERDRQAPLRARLLSQRFGSLFRELLVTFHPDVAGEVKGKSANLAWAARRAEEELIRRGRLAPDGLLISVLDADSRLHRGYLAAVAHQALSHPKGRLHIFQPAILFYANHWRLPAPLRALNSVYSLYELSRMVPSHSLVTQSTYSLSWRAAREVGFWDVDVIPEDSHMFFKVFFHFGRSVKVRPIFLPVYADAAEGPTLWRTLVNQYLQILRWAWGISDVPYVVTRALRARHIPWPTRLARVAWYVEEHMVWPSHWFILTLGGLVAPLLNPAYARSALGSWQVSITQALLAISIPCLVVVLLADWRLRPEHPDGESVLDVLVGWSAFFLLPLVSLPLSTLPALDAHTRLMFGRYLEYRVTEKVPSRARFRGEPAGRQPEPLRGPALQPVFEHAHQHRAYALGGPTAVADSILNSSRNLG